MRASSLTPFTGCRIVTRSLASWNASRSEVATTTGPSHFARGGGEEVVGLVAGAFAHAKPKRATKSGRRSSCSTIESSNSRPDW